MIRIQIAVAAFFLSSTFAQAQELEPLTVERVDGTVASFSVEIADDPDEISSGLMFRESLASDRGMIFDFGAPREANMYMKNVPISLDMLFLNTDGQIEAIAAHAAPQSLRIINPGFPVKGVLEIAGGEAAAQNLQIGDTVRHRIFENVPNDEN